MDAVALVAPASLDWYFSGWLYVMSYPNSPVLKIGYTRRQPRARAHEIGGTLAPMTPKVEIAFRCHEARRLESLVHRRLAHARANGEWFQIDLETAIDAIEATAAAHCIPLSRLHAKTPTS